MTEAPEDKKFERYSLLAGVFTPTSPILNKDLFIGRQKQISKIITSIVNPGEHAILYGERGIGKSSLANVIPAFLNEKTKFRENGGIVTKVTCTKDDTFKTLWERTLKQIPIQNESVTNKIGFLQEQTKNTQSSSLANFIDFSQNVTSGSISDLLNRVSSIRLLFIFDEFDSVVDVDIKRRFAEVIKILSDQASNSTILLVGIGETITDLIGEHASIERCLCQIRLQRMTDDELLEIISNGMERLDIKVSETATSLILYISNGLAYFTHLLCRYAAEDIVLQNNYFLDERELFVGLSQAIANAQESLKSAYYHSTLTNNGDDLYKRILVACAHVTHEDEYGAFQISDIQESFQRKHQQQISIDKLRSRIPYLCESKRNSVLKRLGVKRNYRYKFRNPLFKAYVLLNEVVDSSRNSKA